MTRNHESHFVPISTFRYVVTLRTTLAEIDHRQLPKYVRRASARKHSANTLQPLQLPSKYGASLASFVYENEKDTSWDRPTLLFPYELPVTYLSRSHR